jgi:hypothetical protein
LGPESSNAGDVGVHRTGYRIGLDAALAVVVVVWLATLVVVLVRRGDRDAEAANSVPAVTEVPAQTQRPAAATADVVPQTELPPAEELLDKLEVETGFTLGEVPGADETVPEALAYAIVVENTSDHVVVGLRMTYRFVDAAGARGPSVEAVVDVIRPGERFAVTRVDDTPSDDVAELEVTLEPREWLPADYYEHIDPLLIGDVWRHLRATDIEVGYLAGNVPVVTFTAESSSQEPIEALLQVYVVFRDADGAIVGGLHRSLSRFHIPAGGSVERLRARSYPVAIPGIDPSRTEVYLGDYVWL